MLTTISQHWPEYIIEAAGLGLYMISVGLFATVLWYPGSPVSDLIKSDLLRRLIMGMAMGLTAISIIYSPWGKRSGAHFNPGLTFTFFRLGKIELWDALFYSLFQFAGGLAGVFLIGALLGNPIKHPTVNFVVTTPGSSGPAFAFLAELLISFVLMSTILITTNIPRVNRLTGLFGGILISTYITLEAPLSGMSMNPARTFASALPANVWTSLWIYFTAPPLGMLLAAELYVRSRGKNAVLCAKLHHQNEARCIFRCGYPKVEVKPMTQT